MSTEKVVIISDLHLTKRFDPAKFELIKNIVSDADQLIINGDLWEGFGMSLQEFLISRWKELFPLCKQKNAVYLFGNHDPKSVEDYSILSERVATSYEFSQAGTGFYVAHGDLLDPTLDMRHPNLPKWILNFGSVLERLLISFIGRPYLNVYRTSNQRMKNWHKSNKSEKWLICGHSHLPEIDAATRFANSGIFLRPGLASFLVVHNGKVELNYV